MNIADKIIKHRKANGWSQEDLAEKLDISRQSVSRWENGSALPDAQNVLQLSRLFGVTADYLLDDAYESDRDIPVVQHAEQENKALLFRKKRLHLIAAICFTVSVVCSLIGVLCSESNMQFGLSCFTLALCAGNAAAQFVLFFRKK